jgi:hypothetical protein
MAFASSDLPHPHTHGLALRLAFLLEGRCTGFLRFAFKVHVGLGACSRPGGVWSTMSHLKDDIPAPIAILAQAYQPLWLAVFHGLYRRFTLHSPYRLSSPYPDSRFPGERSSCDSLPAPIKDASVHCPGSSLFMPVDSPGGTGGSMP